MSDENQPISDDDAQLLDELRELTTRVDPVPDDVVAAAKASFTWRTIDAELAELTFDSAAAEEALAGVRGSEGPRMLTFEAPDVIIELEVTAAGSRRNVVGQIVPPEEGRVEVRHGGGTAGVDVDALGRFKAEQIEQGPASVRFIRAAPEGETVATEWVGF